MGLYGGLDVDYIHSRKQLEVGQKILDYMGSTELIANLFRISQTEEKLRKDKIQGADKATSVHYNVGKEVRTAIEKIGGTMPEDLPTPEKSIQQIEKAQALYVLTRHLLRIYFQMVLTFTEISLVYVRYEV